MWFRKRKKEILKPQSSTDRILERFNAVTSRNEAALLFQKFPSWLQRGIKYFLILVGIGILYNILNPLLFMDDTPEIYKLNQKMMQETETIKPELQNEEAWGEEFYSLFLSGQLNDSTILLLNQKYGDSCSYCPN